ncbi:glycerate kinase [Lapillicoccus sp.]|uniref:glycerate kinase family protein n=1 Tax=Lapillicoccus sp. TaxID=1909287 RepID=UPI00398399FA
MRVILAPDRFAGTLTAPEAAEAMAAGWRRRAPRDELVLLPMSDGGMGFLDVLAPSVGGETLAATVSDPLGRPVPAAVLVADRGGVLTAYLDAGQACGPQLLTGDERDPTRTTSVGVGELLATALEAGARRIVVGVGAVATHDAGAGLLAAFGVGSRGRLARGGLALADLTTGDLDRLDAAVDRFRDIELVLATAHALPLLGLQGTSAVDAEGRGATARQAQDLESALGHFADLVRRVRPERADLLTTRPRRLDKEPGAGAGGGLGHALLVLGGRRRSGVDVVSEAVGLREAIEGADLVVTGEGTFDWQSLHDRVVAGVAQLALESGVPSIVVAGQVSVGRRETMAAGLSGTYAVAERPPQVAAALADPVATLGARVARVAATWSPAG